MFKCTYKLRLDLQYAMPKQRISAKVGDTARVVQVWFTEGGNTLPLTDNMTATIYMKLSDGTVLTDTCEVDEDGSFVSYTFTDDITETEGDVSCEIRLSDDNDVVTSPCFTIHVFDRIEESTL